MSSSIENTFDFKASNNESLDKIKILCPEWDLIVEKVNCLDAFRCVAVEMFKDNQNEKTRLYVLELFARDVRKKYPKISTAIWKHYMEVFANVTCSFKKHQKLCWLCSKYDESEIAKNVAECIMPLFK